MSNKDFLIKLRKKIPFLDQIPDEIFFDLDISELYLPDDEISLAREELEKKLDQHVMTYKATGVIPKEFRKCLCSYLKPAKLTKDQLKNLHKFEEKYKNKGVSFAVYQKPLKILTSIPR